ncbi:hypothetical protein BDV97DRAFT_401267 [Delphinella strobiligena]|nr:hypothetical protein BDV97DRAFT_401267 [Delphinella strobiligena]
MNEKVFPLSLRTQKKKMLKARSLIEQHLKVQTTHAQPAHFQGMYSETIIVTHQDGSKSVIQFRAEVLDVLPFAEARKLLGSLVPVVHVLRDEELEDADIWPVYLSYIPGECWAASKKQDEAVFNISVTRSLAQALTKCFINAPSAATVGVVVAKSDRLLGCGREGIEPFLTSIRDLRASAGVLEKLPLFFSHLDLGMMNIMVEDGCVSGIVDWELSPPPLPFGMGLSRIHDLAGQYLNGVHYEREEFRDMEEAFGRNSFMEPRVPLGIRSSGILMLFS